MKILAIDTSTGTLCIGARLGDKVCTYDLQLGTRTSALLVPTLKRVTESLGWKIEEIDYFYCGIGPGSFTGVRVGLATVKALSWSLHKPAVGIPSLDTLARNVKNDHAYVIPVIDAKRGLVYTSIYRLKNGRFFRITGYMLLSPQELVRKLKNNIPARDLSDSVMLGDGLNICWQDCRQDLKGLKALDKDFWRLEARNLIAAAAVPNKKGFGVSSLKPLYLYPKECQIRIKSKRAP